MTPLGAALLRRIVATGPITLADYMAECLLHPEHGYYTQRPAIGGSGDFTTAPEISQMFGEMLGLCLAQSWVDQGSPASFVLAELGPGRGTLMADIWRATRLVPGFHAAARLHLVEAAPRMRAQQAQRLGDLTSPVWLDRVDDLPQAPLWLVANEFFDALPIRQFQRGSAGGWHERVIGLDAARTGLAAGLSAATPLAALSHRLADTQPGDVVELCPTAAPIMASIAGRIAQYGGAALIVDYGGWRSLGDTFQAVKDHAVVDPMATPGQADLTAHVDFEPMAQAATGLGAWVSPLTPQGVLLERLGITARAERLAQSLHGAALDAHVTAHRRLTHPQEMGNLFKALAVSPRGAPPLPGCV
jgi:NADH dehydrogenase [ubiquinone] 1 alpha subcomplex assembly factor 7